MGEFRLSPEAEAELDGIWMHVARESGSIDIATCSGGNHRTFLAIGPVIGRDPLRPTRR